MTEALSLPPRASPQPQKGNDFSPSQTPAVGRHGRKSRSPARTSDARHSDAACQQRRACCIVNSHRRRGNPGRPGPCLASSHSARCLHVAVHVSSQSESSFSPPFPSRMHTAPHAGERSSPAMFDVRAKGCDFPIRKVKSGTDNKKPSKTAGTVRISD